MFLTFLLILTFSVRNSKAQKIPLSGQKEDIVEVETEGVA
ncbi:exported protein of unknown function [Vibrio tapetis subsp. tapetis]|uniref:Uncharacterized protein n=1 Tax=Vibrio tapetis subsp. tapetis TaxID=1671868 RepID=A0A2N8ZB81_9VIBR|nr:exported protein of unknown function [Vibrio tapetis subsp. tapetis]